MTQASPDKFAAPDADHSPAAYWFWHRLPTEEEIRSQIAEMLAGGYQSFQIQPRLAYPIADFLGDDYLAACRLAVAEAARLGMTVGIYDDYNWQSGQAGGRTVHGADHLRECHVFWATAESGSDAVVIDQITSSAADLGPAGMAWQYDEARMAWTDWRVIAALAHPGEAIESADQVIDVTARIRGHHLHRRPVRHLTAAELPAARVRAAVHRRGLPAVFRHLRRALRQHGHVLFLRSAARDVLRLEAASRQPRQQPPLRSPARR
jgi:hypothetical protein